MSESGIVKADLLEPLMEEAEELIAILVTAVKTTKARRRKS